MKSNPNTDTRKIEEMLLSKGNVSSSWMLYLGMKNPHDTIYNLRKLGYIIETKSFSHLKGCRFILRMTPKQREEKKKKIQLSFFIFAVILTAIFIYYIF